ncbi:hypothetical protein LIER_09617 [Lithospermum erythrorhizon]|uniref:beta-fructofuranosidase n=1 Tax=Lithospermum erythrorhizon TaxID=34254 RepID=A0AAV3PHJ4_LITER
MSTNNLIIPPSIYDPENVAYSTPLLNHPHAASSPASQRWRVKVFSGIFIPTILFVSLVFIIVNHVQEPHSGRVYDDGNIQRKVSPEVLTPSSRGVSHGVSEKSFRQGYGGNVAYPWTNSMLSWQRTSYHFQPEKNWMNGKSTI